MPRYSYKCPVCDSLKEASHRITERPEIPCPECGAHMIRAVVKNDAGVDTGFTVTKQMKEAQYRRKRNAELGVKQIERYGTNGGASLVPNVGGTEVASWEEARRLAAEQGKSTKAYDRLIEVESRSQNSRKIDEGKWKKAKEDLHKA